METALFPPAPERATLIVVLGMHRSGTSVTTRAMEALGASFGDNLMPAAAGNNPKGFFEDMDVGRLNIELMEAAGVDWHALPAPDFRRLGGEQIDQFRSRALALLREKCRSGVFALKDPRIARLMPFWQPVFEQIDAQVRYVVAFRHPVSVARSLEARDALAPEKSYLLWLAHVVPALRHTAGQRRALVNYDTLMEAPRDALARLASELDLALDPAKSETFARDFLENGLRHTRFDGADLKRVESMPAVVKTLFGALEAFADAPSPATRLRLDRALPEAETFLANGAPLMARDWGLETQLTEAREHIGQLERAASAEGAHASELERAITHAHARIEMLEREAREREEAAHVLEATIESLEQKCSATQAEAAAQRSQLDRTMADMHAVLNSTSWRITAPFRAAARRFFAP